MIQSTWSCVLALTGRYEQLLNYVVFADWIFFGLTVATVIVFRRGHPLSQRAAGTFQAPGFPLIYIAFVAVAAGVVLSVVWADRSSAWRGAVLLAAGIPVFYWFRRSAPTTGQAVEFVNWSVSRVKRLGPIHDSRPDPYGYNRRTAQVGPFFTYKIRSCSRDVRPYQNSICVGLRR